MLRRVVTVQPLPFMEVRAHALPPVGTAAPRGQCYAVVVPPWCRLRSAGFPL